MEVRTLFIFLLYILLIDKKVRSKSELNTFKLRFEHLKEMSKVLQSQLDVWAVRPTQAIFVRYYGEIILSEINGEKLLDTMGFSTV